MPVQLDETSGALLRSERRRAHPYRHENRADDAGEIHPANFEGQAPLETDMIVFSAASPQDSLGRGGLELGERGSIVDNQCRTSTRDLRR